MDAWHLVASPGEYQRGEVETPEPGPGEIRVKVVASALNHIDHWQTMGRPKPKSFPHVSGSDGAGIIDAVGPGVDRFVPGDEVALNPAITSREAVEELGIDNVFDPSLQLLGEHRWGCHGDYVVVPDFAAELRPSGRTWAEAAAYPVAYTSAWRMLRRGRFEPGMTVLITGVGGGVAAAGQALVQHLGGRAFTTSRDAHKREQSIALGAEDSFDSAQRYPIKADIILDSIGPATWDNCVAALRPGGRLVTCGGTSGQTVELNLPRLFFKHHEIVGATLGSPAEFAYVTSLMSDGIGIVIDAEYDFADYPAALERLRSGNQNGKIVLHHDR